MEFDSEWNDDLMLNFHASSWDVKPDLDMYTDDELLDVPAHLIAAKIREAAFDGRKLVIADPVSTNDAVVRVPDLTQTALDYHPHLTWAHAIDHPPLLPNAVNTELVNKAIPPRVTEPELADKTKLSTYEATAGEVALSAVEKCVVRGYSAIQAVQIAGGDASGLATVLNRAWGGAEIFKPDFKADFLGDVSYARFLARSSKRRFQLYRNIGWVVLVTAGANQASTQNYGENAIINWQRRTELAMYYVHIAAMLEGHTLAKGTYYGITARIPDYAVQYGAWEDCAMSFDPDELDDQQVPFVFQDIADELMKSKLSTFLYTVSAVVRQVSEGTTFKVEDSILNLATRYDKLVFVEPFRSAMVKKETSVERKSDLAFSRRESSIKSTQIQAKSNDPATAVIEAIMKDAKHHLSSSLASISAFLVECIKIGSDLKSGEKVRFVQDVSRYLKSYNDICAEIVTSFDFNDRGKLKKSWDQVMKHNIPFDLIDRHDAIITLRNVTAFALISMERSKASVATKYWANQVKETLATGIRGKKHMIVDKDDSPQIAIIQDIASATRKTYNARYRSRALAYKHAIGIIDREALKSTFSLKAIFWYALSDCTQAVVPKIKDNVISLDVNAGLVKKALITAASEVGKTIKRDPPIVQSLSANDIVKKFDAWIDEAVMLDAKDKQLYFTKLLDKFKEYVAEHSADFNIESELILDVKEPPLPAATATINLAKIIPSKEEFVYAHDPMDIDGAIMHVLDVAKLTGLIDPDDIDVVADMWRKTLGGDATRIYSWVNTARSTVDEDHALDIWEQWNTEATADNVRDALDIS